MNSSASSFRCGAVLLPAMALFISGLPAAVAVALAEATTSGPSSELTEIVVTAQKRAQREQDVPISMTVMGGDDLDKSSIASVSDALSMVPGVAVNLNGQGGETQLTIRGVTAAGSLFTGSSPIGYYMDSVPFGLVRSAIVPDANSYDLDRIEVLRGPQGTLYGASALNGVVRVLTNEADLNDFDFKSRSTLSSTDGGGGNWREDAAVNVPVIDGKLAVRLVAGDEHDSGWINSPLGNHINDGDIKTIRFKVNAQPIDDLSIKLGVNHEDASYGAPPTATNDYTPSTVNQPIHQAFSAYDIKIDERTPWVTVSSATSYLTFANDSLLDTSPGATVYNPPLGTIETSRVFSEEINLNSTIDGPWRWSAGVFYRNARDITYQTFGDFVPAPVDQADTSRSAAVFGEVARRFDDNQFELAVGARYFHDDVGMNQLILFGEPAGTPLENPESTFHALTPRVVLSWFPSHDYTLYASYSQGFRSGFTQGELTLLTAPELPPIKPDRLTNYEIGAKGNLFDNRLSLESAVYYMKWKDIQESLGIQLAGAAPGTYITASVNGESASGMGVDFAVTYRPVQGLQLGVNVGWNGLSEDSAVYSQGGLLFSAGSRIDSSPAYTAGAKAQYDFPFASSGWTGQLLSTARYTSLQTTTSASLGSGLPPLVVESNNITTARVSFAVIAPSHWRTMLYCNNVGNNRGVPLASPTPYSSISQQPRTVGIQLDYSYK
jgi:iron complex outermembrane receptor protein